MFNRSLINTVKIIFLNPVTLQQMITVFTVITWKNRFWSPRADLATLSDSATCKVSPEIHLDVFQIGLNFHIHK